MQKVGNKEFPYTPAGMEAARKERNKTKNTNKVNKPKPNKGYDK